MHGRVGSSFREDQAGKSVVHFQTTYHASLLVASSVTTFSSAALSSTGEAAILQCSSGNCCGVVMIEAGQKMETQERIFPTDLRYLKVSYRIKIMDLFSHHFGFLP